eukprot:5198415-Pyramimonas_sp.AAC.1
MRRVIYVAGVAVLCLAGVGVGVGADVGVAGVVLCLMLECLGAVRIHSPRRDEPDSLWRQARAEEALQNAASAAARAKAFLQAGTKTCAHRYMKAKDGGAGKACKVGAAECADPCSSGQCAKEAFML